MPIFSYFGATILVSRCSINVLKNLRLKFMTTTLTKNDDTMHITTLKTYFFQLFINIASQFHHML
jgi:hypothetical protein